MKLFSRIAPALLLLVEAPLIAEFLLGDFNVRQLGYLGIFIPLYGAGALLIREMVRRSGRGWATMLLLGLAYALLLEGIVNQTLFNPDYAGAHLLKYGFVPSLGTSFNYATYILTLHTVWSVSTPIALAEGMAGERSQEPWLTRPELIGTGILCLLGLAGTTASTIERFKYLSSILQYESVALLIVTLVAIAFRAVPKPKIQLSSSPQTPGAWLVCLGAVALSSAFQLWFHYAPDQDLNPLIGLAVFLILDGIALFACSRYSSRAGWGRGSVVAAATGAIVTYGWFGLRRLMVSGHTAMGVKATTVDVVGQWGVLLALLGLCWVAYLRSLRPRQASIGQPGGCSLRSTPSYNHETP